MNECDNRNSWISEKRDKIQVNVLINLIIFVIQNSDITEELNIYCYLFSFTKLKES